MSVDFNALVTRPMTVGDLVTTSGSILAELVGIDDPIADPIVAGRIRHLGRVVHEGEPLAADQLASTWIGPDVPDPLIEVVDETGSDLVQLVVSALPGDWILVVSPRRTARGIVTGLAIALAAALLGEGRVIDNDLRLVDGHEGDVAGFVAATRLPPEDRPPEDAALAYLRQFPQTAGWPPA